MKKTLENKTFHTPPMAIKYLDPKIDMVFKKIFGTRKHITIDFLNAMLPLEVPITEVEFVTGELAPGRPYDKLSIVDVRCRDAGGRQFLVEMQNRWERGFEERIFFSSSLAYVSQLPKGAAYETLRPVYMLALLDTVFLPEVAEWHHHYLVHRNGVPRQDLNFIQAVVAELPKHPDESLNSARDLWAHFLSKTDETLREPSEELAEYSPIREALAMSEEAAFDETERQRYLAELDEQRKQVSFDQGRRAREQELAESRRELAESRKDNAEKNKRLAEQANSLKRAALALYEQKLSPEAIAETLGAELSEVKKWLGLEE